MKSERFEPRHIVAIVVAVCTTLVLAPVSVMAASGTLVHITDPANARYKARVDGGKLRVGDGDGAFTVNGTVATSDRNAIVYRSPVDGLVCGASSAGHKLGTFDTSRFSKLRLEVQSGAGYQSIVQMFARAGTVVQRNPFVDYTVPAGNAAHYVIDAPPTAMDLTIYFCNDADIFIYGIR